MKIPPPLSVTKGWVFDSFRRRISNSARVLLVTKIRGTPLRSISRSASSAADQEEVWGSSSVPSRSEKIRRRAGSTSGRPTGNDSGEMAGEEILQDRKSVV